MAKQKDIELKEIEMFSKLFTESFTQVVHKISGRDLMTNPLYSKNLESYRRENEGKDPKLNQGFKVNIPWQPVNHRRRMIKAWKDKGRLGYLEYLEQFVTVDHPIYPKLMENLDSLRTNGK